MIHGGGNNVSNDSTWRLHGYTRSVLAELLNLVECTDVDKNSTAFPGPNARIISGVDVGDGTPMTEEELKVFIAEDLGIVM